jgi:hypothetical protein
VSGWGKHGLPLFPFPRYHSSKLCLQTQFIYIILIGFIYIWGLISLLAMRRDEK